MNERIFELAKQALNEYPATYHNEARIPETYLEKFAELLVQECISNLEVHATCFDGDVGRGIRVASRLTKEHFGVENV